jgi:hypothetical protein
MRAAEVANVGDRRAAKLRWPRHAPTRHNKLALAISSIANDRSHLVGKDGREQRQVASPIIGRAEAVSDRGLTFCEAIEVAHFVLSGGQSPLTSRSFTIPGGKSGGRLCSRSGR